MSTRLDELRQYTSNLSTRHAEVKQAAQTARNQQSAQIASRLSNPVSSPVIRSTQGANIASRLDGGTYAANTGTQAAIVQREKDQKSAQAAANLDNSLMGQATRDKNIRRLNSAMDDLYTRMEGYRNNGQAAELARSERQYKLLDERLEANKSAGGAMEDAAKWEQKQEQRIIQAGGTELMNELAELADLKAAVDVEEKANMGSEILRAPSAQWMQYQQRVNALKAQYGEDAADWIAYAERMANEKSANEFSASMEAFGKEHPVLSILPRVAVNKISGLGTLDAAVQKMQNAATGSDRPIDYNRGAQLPARMATGIQQGATEDMGQVGRFLYNTGLSILDSATAMGSGGWGTVLLGGSAATSAMQDAISRGATDEQALTIGLVAGGMEAVMEKLSIDNLFGLKSAGNAKDVVLNILKQAGAEGTEEGLTTIANTIADALIMGNESELQTQKRELMAQGYSEAEAEKTALKEWGKNLALDVAGGALSGGVFAGAKATVDMGSGRIATPPAEVRNDSVKPTPQRPTVESVMPTVQPKAAKPIQQQTETEVEELPMMPGYVEVQDAQPAMGAADSGFDPYSHASIEYGAIPPGENPARVVDVPKSVDGERNVMQTVRTIMEADATPDAAIPELEQAVVEGKFSKMPITDQSASDRAEATIRRVGYQQALADWRSEVRSGKVSKDSVVVGETLYNAAVNTGDMKSAVKIAVELSTQVRSAAQALQAVRMLKKMSPAAQLYGVKQSVDNLQKTLTDKYGNRAPNLVINEELAAKFLQAETDADRKTAEEALYKDIAKQIPATFADKWNTWRYLSMLGNPRTHIRNISGNAMFAPVRFVKNKLGAAMEAGAQAVGLIDKSQRTKAFGAAGKDLIAAAKADYANVEQQILGGEKYNSSSNIIEENRRIFDNVVLETLRKGNSKLLELEDSVFSKGAYASSLASYLKAQGFTAADFTGNGMTAQQKDAARSYAIKEAQKATYRDLNAFSELVTSIGFKNPENSKTRAGALAKKATNAVVEGVLPFKKTPANILARAMEYSPAGLAKAITTDVYAVAKGKISAGEYMDRLASGLTGTGLFALGYFLSKSGLLVGSPDDEEQADLEGRQPYSLEIGGKSITLDWLAPEAMPVFMGVELAEMLAERTGEAVSLDSIKAFFRGVTGPVLEMSMMSGLQDALDSVSYADDKVLAAISSAALGYMSQAVPTLFGQIERVIGTGAETRQTTFTQEGRFLDKDTQYVLGNTLNKVPIFDYSQIPYIDAWGRQESTGNAGARSFNNLANPAYVSDINETPVDAEIKRLEKETGENLTPRRADKVLTINGEKIILTADEYVTYAQAKGQNDLTFRQSLLDSAAYENLDDKTRVKAMEYSRELANSMAIKEAGFEPDAPEWQKELYGADIETISNALSAKALESQLGTGAQRYSDMADYASDSELESVVEMMLSNSQKVAYETYIEKANVSMEQYLDALSFYENATSDKKNGKTVAGSKKAKVENMIDGLSELSEQQKTALYLAMPGNYSRDTMPDWK